MLYFKCPTCKTILADKQIIYDSEADKIRDDPKLTDEEKDQMLQDLPRKLKLIRYCCMFRLITSIDDIKILV
jgi:DNA-directed RNA polymerase subunit N (RpoN/RPB10)